MNPIVVAVDTLDYFEALHMVANTRNHVGMVKLGLEFFCAHGYHGVRLVAQSMPLFLDLKFHDIPTTVVGAINAVASLHPTFLSIHISAGEATCRAAVEALANLADRPKLLGVTYLTSQESYPGWVVGRAIDAKHWGLDGVICSPLEAKAVRAIWADGIIVTPGVRPAGAALNDQKRVATPREAIEAGANHIVIGRPITKADDPGAAAAAILASLS